MVEKSTPRSPLLNIFFDAELESLGRGDHFDTKFTKIRLGFRHRSTIWSPKKSTRNFLAPGKGWILQPISTFLIQDCRAGSILPESVIRSCEQGLYWEPAPEEAQKIGQNQGQIWLPSTQTNDFASILHRFSSFFGRWFSQEPLFTTSENRFW